MHEEYLRQSDSIDFPPDRLLLGCPAGDRMTAARLSFLHDSSADITIYSRTIVTRNSPRTAFQRVQEKVRCSSGFSLTGKNDAGCRSVNAVRFGGGGA